MKLIGIEKPLSLPGNPEGKFYACIISGPDSVFTDLKSHFDWGKSCPNIAYRTALKTVDENDAKLFELPVRVSKTTGTFDDSENSTYVVYLHDGIFTASININGTDISKSVIVKGNAQTVILSPSSGNKWLTGKIVDSTGSNLAIEGANVKISKYGLVITSTKSVSSSEFKASLPEGTYLVEITKQGYIPFSIYQKVENDQPSTQMQTVELIPGSGMGGFRGVITNAVTGKPIDGVTLSLRSG